MTLGMRATSDLPCRTSVGPHLTCIAQSASVYNRNIICYTSSQVNRRWEMHASCLSRLLSSMTSHLGRTLLQNMFQVVACATAFWHSIDGRLAQGYAFTQGN